MFSPDFAIVALDVLKEVRELVRGKQKEKEISESAKKIVRKILRRFTIDWDQFNQNAPIRYYDETTELYSGYRSIILEVFVELEDYLDSETKDGLYRITNTLESGRKTIPSLGKESYEERKKYGDLASSISKELISKLGGQNGEH